MIFLQNTKIWSTSETYVASTTKSTHQSAISNFVIPNTSDRVEDTTYAHSCSPNRDGFVCDFWLVREFFPPSLSGSGAYAAKVLRDRTQPARQMTQPLLPTKKLVHFLVWMTVPVGGQVGFAERTSARRSLRQGPAQLGRTRARAVAWSVISRSRG